MGMRSMIEDALGYVTDEDRASLHRFEQKIQQEKLEAQQGTPATMVNSGIGTALQMGQHMAQSAMTGETTAAATSRRDSHSRRVRTIVEETTRQDADDLDYGG